jgi:N6-adenosine-specific RNA methylase IME4
LYDDKMADMKTTGDGVVSKYNLLSLDRIRSFLTDEKVSIADDAHLWLWVTNSMLVDGYHAWVCDSWGFRPKSILTWVKGRIKDDMLVQHIAQGRRLRNSTEHCILAVRGNPEFKLHNVPSCFVHPGKWEGRMHSEKPDVVHALAELCCDGPYLEVFGRKNRPGWTVIGDQIPVDSVVPVSYDHVPSAEQP